MAVIKQNVLGFFSGRLGEIILRIRYNKPVMYARSTGYKKTKSENLKNERKKFGLTVNFAVFVNKIPLIWQIWRKAKIEGKNGYVRIIKHNAGKNSKEQLSPKNIISPPGLSLKITGAAVTQDGICSVLEILDGKFLTTVYAFVIIYFYNPGVPKDYRLMQFSKETSGSNDGREFNISFNPDPLYLDALDNFQNLIAYFALVEEDKENNILRWTSTAVVEIPREAQG